MKHVSRREFGVMMTAGLVGGALPVRRTLGDTGSGPPRIEEVIDRIERRLGAEWSDETVDTVKAGDPTRVATGVVTTSLATLPVLREAAGSGANLVITSEPTFYSRTDAPTPPAERDGTSVPSGDARPADPVYAAKNALVDEYGLVVFRLSEHWRSRAPDPFVVGLARALGPSGNRSAGAEPVFDVDPISLGALVDDLGRTLGARGGIRVIGDRETPVRRVALLPGTTSITASLETFPTADVVIAGEVREWESVEYARDVVYSGQRKGLVLLGRILSEDPGMSLMAEWLQSFVTEVPVWHLSSGDPYWRPGS